MKIILRVKGEEVEAEAEVEVEAEAEAEVEVEAEAEVEKHMLVACIILSSRFRQITCMEESPYKHNTTERVVILCLFLFSYANTKLHLTTTLSESTSLKKIWFHGHTRVCVLINVFESGW